MKWRVAAGHAVGTISIQVQSFNSYLISQVFTNFVNIAWSFCLNKYTIHWQFMAIYDLWNSMIFLNFNTSLVILFFTFKGFWHCFNLKLKQLSCKKEQNLPYLITAFPIFSLRSTFSYFEILWCFKKFSFHHMWNDARLLLINMVYTSSITSRRTT